MSAAGRSVSDRGGGCRRRRDDLRSAGVGRDGDAAANGASREETALDRFDVRSGPAASPDGRFASKVAAGLSGMRRVSKKRPRRFASRRPAALGGGRAPDPRVERRRPVVAGVEGVTTAAPVARTPWSGSMPRRRERRRVRAAGSSDRRLPARDVNGLTFFALVIRIDHESSCDDSRVISPAAISRTTAMRDSRVTTSGRRRRGGRARLALTRPGANEAPRRPSGQRARRRYSDR
jgi:hypothetical protein